MLRSAALWSSLFIIGLRSAAQEPELLMKAVRQQFAAEKVYIHYDKEYYVAGETIWLKAYMFNEGGPSTLSSNFYLQLIDAKGEAVVNKHYPVIDAVAKGNIDIPDSLAQGTYYIHAVTTTLLNDNEAFIYKKPVFIFSSGSRKQGIIAASQPVSLQFFPESGDLVDGLLTVVAFKATDQDGMPVAIDGTIKTAEGTAIVPFKSFHNGTGKVQFKPQGGKKYVAEVQTTGGPRSYPLPEVKAAGVNLKVADEKGGKLFILARGEKDKKEFDLLRLVVQINNHIIYDNEITLEGYPSAKGHLVTDSLPSGILHFVVFNKEGMPLAERIAFVDNREYINKVEAVIVKKGAARREENIIELVFPDSLSTSCSVSITDFDASNVTGSDNILSKFMLTSYLAGYIHNPSYYFNNKNDSVTQALDNLMLTHGWSRFNITKTEPASNEIKKYTHGHMINISGKVTLEELKKPAEGGKLDIFLVAEDSSMYAYSAPVDERGGFMVDSLYFMGDTKIYYTYLDRKGREQSARIETADNILPEMLVKKTLGVPSRQASIPANIKEMNVKQGYVFAEEAEGKTLQSVVLSSRISRPVDLVNAKYTSPIFSSTGKVVVDNITHPPPDRSMNGFDFVKNRIPMVDTQYGGFVNKRNFSLYDVKNSRGKFYMRYWEVALYINEMQADITMLRSLRADQISLVKFYEAGFVGSSSSFPGGAIAVYMNYEGVLAKPDRGKSISHEGYSLVREFYSPDYSAPRDKPDAPDNRTTLYWNPDVYPARGSATVPLRFFNNDKSRKFRMVLEGFDARGRLMHLERIIGE